MLFLTSLAGTILFGGVLLWQNELQQLSLQHLRANAWPLISMTAIALIAEFAIITSISEKNATLASMVEISYPFFTALAAHLLFRQTDLTWGTACAGLLILAGTGLILWLNQA